MAVDPRFVEILKTVGELDPGFSIESSQQLQADLGIDSLKLIDVVLAVEREFGTEVKEDALVRAKTVGDFWLEIEGALEVKI